MNAAERFVMGRGAVSVRELGLWLGRGHSYVYALIARGELRMFGPGRVTADSVIEFYTRHEGGAANEVKQSTSSAVPVAALHRRESGRRVTGAAITRGGVS